MMSVFLAFGLPCQRQAQSPAVSGVAKEVPFPVIRLLLTGLAIVVPQPQAAISGLTLPSKLGPREVKAAATPDVLTAPMASRVSASAA